MYDTFIKCHPAKVGLKTRWESRYNFFLLYLLTPGAYLVVHTPSTATSDYNTSYVTAIYKCSMTSATREIPHSHTRTAVTCPYTVMSIDQVMTQHLSDATSQIDGLTFISYFGPAYTPATTCRPCYKPDEGQKTEAQRASSLNTEPIYVSGLCI